nr:ABC transporter substrate-binding protein [Brachybacterium halotolerans]
MGSLALGALGISLAVPAVSGCSQLGSAATKDAAASGTFAEAKVLDNPSSYEGPSTADLGEAGVRPVATSPTPSLPVTMKDSQGTKVTIEDTSRILAIDLYGSTSRIVYDLGLGDSVVGRDVSSGFDEIKDKPQVTQNGHELNAEAILALDPSLIITDSSLGPWDVILQMRDAGVPVVVVDSKRSIDTTPDLIRQVAEAVGLPEEGEKLASRTKQEIEDTIASIDGHRPDAEPLRMLFFYARGTSGVYYIFGEGSGADDLINGVGGVDVAKEIGWEGMKPMTDEAIIDAKPDLLLMMTKGLESRGGVDGLLDSKPAIALTPAGQKHRIVDMADTDILSFGPATAGVLDALATAIYAPTPSDGASAQGAA